ANAGGGGVEDGDLTGLGAGPHREVEGGERYLEAVGELVHEDAVAGEDGGVHGTAGDVVPVGDGGAEGGEDEDEDEDGPDLAAPVVDELASCVRGHGCVGKCTRFPVGL